MTYYSDRHQERIEAQKQESIKVWVYSLSVGAVVVGAAYVIFGALYILGQ